MIGFSGELTVLSNDLKCETSERVDTRVVTVIRITCFSLLYAIMQNVHSIFGTCFIRCNRVLPTSEIGSCNCTIEMRLPNSPKSLRRFCDD